MQYYPFDSRKTLYRAHLGAVAAGKILRLRLLLHRDACCYEAFLRLRKDNEDLCEILMSPAEELEDYRFYDAEVTLSQGLYWYDFRYTSAHGEFFVVKCEGGLGIVSQTPGNCWQQTVYDDSFSTPEWLKGGIIYQIFPDRFYRSGKEHTDVPKDRFLCDDWSKQPEFRQTTDLCTLGNDYYGGDLLGIQLKLPYIASLGVTCIYLNPIFEAHSNHRYNTADYLKVDTLLGDKADLENLCHEAQKYGISIILDGVFSHTGDDSIYFNKHGRYDSCGAYNSTVSPYYSWFNFSCHPNDYNAWWGIKTLPETNEQDPSFLEFITGENGVLRHWLRCGIRGWRLDVADELPDSFLEELRKAVKSETEDAYILGEVWEDATNKISYGARRKFLLGNQLDSVMNYPFANAIIGFVRGENAKVLNETVCSVIENYPKCAVDLLMNHIGTHDTARAITCLAKGYAHSNDREFLSHQILSKEEYERGVVLLKCAAVLQYTLPGVPALFYGDEAGVQGYGDPFCRATYPWGQEDVRLVEFYRQLGKMRRENSAFKDGEYVPVSANDGVIIYKRQGSENSVLVAVNRTENEIVYTLSYNEKAGTVFFGNPPQNQTLKIEPLSFSVLEIKNH